MSSTKTKKAAASKKKAAPAKKGPAKKAPAKRPLARADYGAPIDAFFAKQPEALRPIALELRKMVEAAAPGAESSLKWGMPFFSLGKGMVCAIGGHKAHVNLILSGPPGTFADPKGLLIGDGKTGRHLKLTTMDGFPRAEIKKWLAAAVANAKKA